MAITDSLAQLASTLISSVHTRLELASVELEEELNRFSSSLLWSLAAMFFAGLAILVAILTLIALFWDSYRYTVLLSLLGLFSLLAIGIFLRVRSAMRNKPAFLSYTLAELKKDSASLHSADRTVVKE
ncbi:phage holin family protein [Undibacterium sp. Di26W]|uniref:phage holin family protein n=1 Tax=Undibacterium sp. Di26W TaxID=3413035 RepID=UPI003BF05F3D